MSEEWIRTACPRNCYSSCGFFIKTEHSRVTGYAPDPDNMATPEGMCLKGQSYLERIYSPDRLRYPLRRNQKGGYDRISWDDALDEIVHQLTEVKRTSGSQAVFYYSGSGMSGLLNDLAWLFWENYGGVTTTYGNLCWPAGLEATRLTLGENKHNVPWDLVNARLIIFWGKNAVETNVQEMVFVDRAIAQGAEVIVVDPRHTPTADKAHLLIQPKPGTDGALALGIAKILIDQGMIDNTFIDSCVLGFDAFRQQVASWTIEKVTEITGVPARFIRLMADKIGTVKPMTLLPGYGLQRYSNGGQTIRCLLSLSVITGNIGKQGACWHYANLQSYVFDALKEPLSYYPPDDPGKFRYGISKTRLGLDMLNTDEPPLRFSWVERGNPITQNPDSRSVRKAFDRLDFTVVSDQFLTDTAAMADIVLPAKTLFEQSDIIGSYWNPYIQLKPGVIDPPGEVKTETEVYHLLAKRMWPDNGSLISNFPADHRQTEEWLQQRINGHPGITWERLQRGALIPEENEEIAFADLHFNTPSGRIELYSDTATTLWNVSPVPQYVPLSQPSPSDRFPLFLQSPNTKNRIHSQFGNLEVIRRVEGDPVLDMNPGDASARNIREGDWVRVWNNRGEFRVKAHLDAGLLPGVVSIPNGFWQREGAGVNLLTAPEETDMGHGAAFHNTRVEVTKTDRQ